MAVSVATDTPKRVSLTFTVYQVVERGVRACLAGAVGPYGGLGLGLEGTGVSACAPGAIKTNYDAAVLNLDGRERLIELIEWVPLRWRGTPYAPVGAATFPNVNGPDQVSRQGLALEVGCRHYLVRYAEREQARTSRQESDHTSRREPDHTSRGREPGGDRS